MIGRDREHGAGERFLKSIADGSASFVLVGEAGIGKTTVWRDLVASAVAADYHVLSCRPSATEVTLSFAGLADLLRDVDPGMLSELEPLLTDIVVTRNSSDRSLDPWQTAELAVEIFGEDRVQSADRLDDAIETAVALADEAVAETGPGSGGVLITGSVITAGDARRRLAPAGGELPAEPPASQPSRHSFTAAELS